MELSLDAFDPTAGEQVIRDLLRNALWLVRITLHPSWWSCGSDYGAVGSWERDDVILRYGANIVHSQSPH